MKRGFSNYLSAARRAPARFPLVMGSSGRYLKDGFGNPFLINGDAAYSLIAQLSGSGLAQYLNAMQALGVNAILVNLFEHFFSDNPPANALGVAPFSTPEDIRTLNTTYFNHALTVVRAAAARNMVVFLEHFYLGFEGGDQGWFAALNARTPAELAAFGTAIGQAFYNEPNIIWVSGGDYTPASMAKVNALTTAVAQASPGTRLFSFHTSPYGNSATVGTSKLNVNAVYIFDTTGAPSDEFWSAYNLSGPVCWINFEPRYEGFASSVQWIREQWWGAFLAGGCGSIPGAEPRWHFDAPSGFITTGWVASLTSAMTLDYPYLPAFASTVPWQDLVPEQGASLVTAGRGTAGTNGYVTAARTASGSAAVLYMPPGSGPVTVDRTKLSGPFSADWFDPQTGNFTAIGTGIANTGTQQFTRPDSNDWVLRLKV